MTQGKSVGTSAGPMKTLVMLMLVPKKRPDPRNYKQVIKGNKSRLLTIEVDTSRVVGRVDEHLSPTAEAQSDALSTDVQAAQRKLGICKTAN